MNFVGTGKRLQQGDIGEAARMLGVETAVLLAFLEVEAAGRGFDNRNRPKMLRETHIFYRELGPGAKRDEAIAQGLATRKWTRNYSSDSYPDLHRMIEIDPAAALRSCSWALPQILGNNHKAAGFTTAMQMVQTMMQGEREQLIAMVTLLKNWGAQSLLVNRNFADPESWRAIADLYNGPAYEKNKYHIKLAEAYRKHKGSDAMEIPTSRVLRLGHKGEVVRNLQTDLQSLGYTFDSGVDGRYGPETEANVRAFQRKQGLTVDGVVGVKTFAAVARALEIATVDRSPEPPEWNRGGGLLARLIAAIVALFKKG